MAGDQVLNYLRLLSGAFVGSGGLILLWRGEYEKGMILLIGMLSFFVGEKNGERKIQAAS